jgi:phosphoglycolate phosphatase-like HAD superfamily hydrolase
MRVKILSDFDGVWTDQAAEAEHARRVLVREAARAARVPMDEAEAHFAELLREVRARPGEHGWAPDGRITAYVDEDPLLVSSALAHRIERGAGEAARYRAAICAGPDGGTARFAERCFREAMGSFREEHSPALLPDAAELLEALHAAGAEVVVVSNSSAEKIVGWFREAGVDAGEEPGRRLRVRGSAAKWRLGPSDERIEVGGREVFVDRPSYRDVLERERADLIVGDVFSLDLALPHVLRSARGAGGPRLVLRRHAHTPAWVLAGEALGAIDACVGDLAELVPMVAELEG